MTFFNQTITNVIFIFISKEKHWIKKNIPHLKGYNIAVNPVKNVATIADFVLLSLCNHSIINYGTYGTAAAFLSGGTTLVYDINVPVDGKESTLAIGIVNVLPNWFLCNEIECKLYLHD
ncbi:hypothetical protein ILUMI_10480 [Ignelater luminosus]|uniref:L-Fucosyltransferase n=1 Tax=Ignelater luminosus TaxID=2038154 RepID=A0A8K0CXV9_IGNLU|nr:hypothetical protein ILUMI_10480 [Ignelater luminosus]